MSWQAVRGECAAERMRSIVTEGLGPADRGVAYLWVTPFAGQALAIPRQPPTTNRP